MGARNGVTAALMVQSGFTGVRNVFDCEHNVLEALWLKTGKQLYLDIFRFWLKIFAVAFAMGVVSGIGPVALSP